VTWIKIQSPGICAPVTPTLKTYSTLDPTACPIQLTTGDTDSAPLTALNCSLKHIHEDKLWQQEAPANSTVHTVLITCSANILSNANMLRLLHRSVCLGSPCSSVELLRCLALPLPTVFIWAKNLLSLHTSCPFHTLADLLRPLGVPHCLGASLDTSHLLIPHSSLVCLIICFSHADLITLTQEIPPHRNLLRSLPGPPLNTAYILYQAVKLSPQMLRPLSWPSCLQ